MKNKAKQKEAKRIVKEFLEWDYNPSAIEKKVENEPFTKEEKALLKKYHL